MQTAFWQPNCFASIIKVSQRNPKLEIAEMRTGSGLHKEDAVEPRADPDGREQPRFCIADVQGMCMKINV